ncbi:MAG: hypothetical protein KGJ06_06155 [Pseudomonadota bacterium]|nr:hypothetical protein [Pseudomonadota bacterium]
MVIHINPNRINVSPGASGKADRRRSQQATSGDYVVPSRAEEGHIPAAETLSTMIRSAVEALRKGVYWDRGTILNLLV